MYAVVSDSCPVVKIHWQKNAPVSEHLGLFMKRQRSQQKPRSADEFEI